ncbi:MAG: cytochrome c biogenesis protein ResB [bacterium]
MIKILGSIRLTLVILTIIIILSIWGSLDPEGKLYYHPVYLGSLSLLGLNILTCVLKRVKNGRLTMKSAGYFLSHIGFLVILLGALTSLVFGFRTLVWLGEGDRISDISIGGNILESLGCAVVLQSFEIDLHDSGMPDRYVSRVLVSCPDRPEQEHEILVNKPLKVNEYRLFQSSFRLQPVQTATLEMKLPDDTWRRFDIRVPGEAVELETGDIGSLRIRGLQYEPDFVLYDSRRAGSRSAFPLNPAVLISVENERDDADVFWTFLHHRHHDHMAEIRSPSIYFAAVDQAYQSGIEIVRDPGMKWVMIGGVLLMAGLGLYLAAALFKEIDRNAH